MRKRFKNNFKKSVVFLLSTLIVFGSMPIQAMFADPAVEVELEAEETELLDDAFVFEAANEIDEIEVDFDTIEEDVTDGFDVPVFDVESGEIASFMDFSDTEIIVTIDENFNVMTEPDMWTYITDQLILWFSEHAIINPDLLTINVPDGWVYQILDFEGRPIVRLIPSFEGTIVVDIDEDWNVSISPDNIGITVRVDRENEYIAVFVPPGTNRENIELNLPDGWEYIFCDDDIGRISVLPPVVNDIEVTITVDCEMNISVSGDVGYSVSRRPDLVNGTLVLENSVVVLDGPLNGSNVNVVLPNGASMSLDFSDEFFVGGEWVISGSRTVTNGIQVHIIAPQNLDDYCDLIDVAVTVDCYLNVTVEGTEDYDVTIGAEITIILPPETNTYSLEMNIPSGWDYDVFNAGQWGGVIVTVIPAEEDEYCEFDVNPTRPIIATVDCEGVFVFENDPFGIVASPGMIYNPFTSERYRQFRFQFTLSPVPRGDAELQREIAEALENIVWNLPGDMVVHDQRPLWWQISENDDYYIPRLTVMFTGQSHCPQVIINIDCSFNVLVEFEGEPVRYRINYPVVLNLATELIQIDFDLPLLSSTEITFNVLDDRIGDLVIPRDVRIFSISITPSEWGVDQIVRVSMDFRVLYIPCEEELNDLHVDIEVDCDFNISFNGREVAYTVDHVFAGSSLERLRIVLEDPEAVILRGNITVNLPEQWEYITGFILTPTGPTSTSNGFSLGITITWPYGEENVCNIEEELVVIDVDCYLNFEVEGADVALYGIYSRGGESQGNILWMNLANLEIYDLEFILVNVPSDEWEVDIDWVEDGDHRFVRVIVVRPVNGGAYCEFEARISVNCEFEVDIQIEGYGLFDQSINYVDNRIVIEIPIHDPNNLVVSLPGSDWEVEIIHRETWWWGFGNLETAQIVISIPEDGGVYCENDMINQIGRGERAEISIDCDLNINFNSEYNVHFEVRNVTDPSPDRPWMDITLNIQAHNRIAPSDLYFTLPEGSEILVFSDTDNSLIGNRTMHIIIRIPEICEFNEPPIQDQYITIDVDCDRNVTVTGTEEYDTQNTGYDSEGDIYITLPAEVDRETLVVNTPGDSWEYRLVEEEDGRLTVIVTPNEGDEYCEMDDDDLDNEGGQGDGDNDGDLDDDGDDDLDNDDNLDNDESTDEEEEENNNLPQTGVIETSVAVAGVAIAGAGTIVAYAKKKK